jgi:hypothetical protein
MVRPATGCACPHSRRSRAFGPIAHGARRTTARPVSLVANLRAATGAEGLSCFRDSAGLHRALAGDRKRGGALARRRRSARSRRPEAVASAERFGRADPVDRSRPLGSLVGRKSECREHLRLGEYSLLLACAADAAVGTGARRELECLVWSAGLQVVILLRDQGAGS